MICQFTWRINTPAEDFWEISLKELYKRFLNAVQLRNARFYMPSSEGYCGPDEYILNGGYIRDRIVDIQRVQCSDGSFRYEKVEIRDFRIQRILDKQTGHTHAILPDVFVPYKNYSLRYILFHFREFFRQYVTQEKYCLDAEIEIEAFRHGLTWMREHITVLAGMGLVKNYQDNWQIMRQWVQKLNADPHEWTAKSLRKLNLGLFQDRRMPENTMYRNYEWSG